ncbi:MAG: hypothetical protein OXL95_09580 [Nitrospira sp.]|nr:hypothetical protein [Nitrospira sp.]MDE0485875.1 hypothetical protein [Nitrospira sp.]
MNQYSEQTQHIIWNGLLDVSRYVRYIDKLCTKYQWWRNFVYVLFGVSGSSSLLTLLNVLPGFFQSITSAAIALALIWSLTLKPGEKAERLATIKLDLDLLESEYRTLWERVYRKTINDQDAIQEHDRLTKNVTKIMSHLNVKTDDQLNEECAEETYLVEAQRYPSVA